MGKNITLVLQNLQRQKQEIELKECNELTKKYGLSLSNEEIQEVINSRFKSLEDTGRIEFSGGILKKLIEAFCDSSYIMQENYNDTLLELQESFYFFKNECMDRISDDELISFMKKYFDGECQGSLEYLSGTTLEELCRNTRY